MPAQPTPLEDLPAHERQLRTRLKIFTRLALGASVIGYVQMMYSGWFIVSALIFLLVALVCGLLALVTMYRLKAKPLDYALMGFLMLGCLFMVFSGSVQLIFLDQTNAYADCLNNATTLSRQEQCNVQLKDSMLGGVLGTN